MTQTVIITRGLPASGKTTWSRKWVHDHPSYKRINRDDLRMMIYENMWNKKREEAVLLARKEMIWAFLTARYNLVLDDTNLDPSRMAETLEIVQDWKDDISQDPGGREIELKIRIKDFTKVPLEECIRRNAKRKGSIRVPERFIRLYYNKYIKGGKNG